MQWLQQTLIGQFEAALAMLQCGIRTCPAEHWEEKIAGGTFRWVAYHTLFFCDLYLSPSAEAFELRELHARGGDERDDVLSRGLDQQDALAYVTLCREKVQSALASETSESLQGPSGFPWYPVSRYELHLINLRHIQHHTGALYAYLRRVDKSFQESGNPLPWIASGWL